MAAPYPKLQAISEMAGTILQTIVIVVGAILAYYKWIHVERPDQAHQQYQAALAERPQAIVNACLSEAGDKDGSGGSYISLRLSITNSGADPIAIDTIETFVEWHGPPRHPASREVYPIPGADFDFIRSDTTSSADSGLPIGSIGPGETLKGEQTYYMEPLASRLYRFHAQMRLKAAVWSASIRALVAGQDSTRSSPWQFAEDWFPGQTTSCDAPHSGS